MGSINGKIDDLRCALEELVEAVEDALEEQVGDPDSPLAMAVDRAVDVLNELDEDEDGGFEEEE
jgi:hypothetical protein